MRQKVIATLLLLGCLLVGVFSAPRLVSAQGQFSLISLVSEQCRECGACSICDLMNILTKTMRYLLSLSGALALALFVWGGLELMMSQGKAEKVEQGKKIISGTVVGLAIILLMAWVWPNWIISALKGVPGEGSPQTIFGGDAWWLTPCQNFNNTMTCANKEETRSAGSQPASNTKGGCTVQDANGNVQSTLPPGTPCDSLEGSFCNTGSCACDERGICRPSCRLDAECTGTNNYCRRSAEFPSGSVGVCGYKEPGASCTTYDGCPDIFTVPGRRDTSTLFCEPSSQKCLIDLHSLCRLGDWNASQFCKNGATSCINAGPGRKTCR